MENIETQIDRIVIKTEARLLAVARQGIADTIAETQKPKAQGGRMPVLTGFLRASGVAAVNSIPRGPTKGLKTQGYSWAGESINIVLAQMKLGDTFYWGWTAIYANVQEIRNGFLGGALMNWQRNIDKAVNFFRNKDLK